MLFLHSSARPEMTDGDFQLWLDACQSVSSARSVPRRRPHPETLPEAWAYRPDHPAPVVSYGYAGIQGNQSHYEHRLPVAMTRGIRSIEINDTGLVDEYGEPYAYPFGSETEMGAYRTLERARSVLEKRYIQGHRFQPVSPFGPEETRFRTMSTEPYFPDICGTFHHRTGDKIVWNYYRLG